MTAMRIVVDGTPEEVRARLDRGLVRVAELWFPTRAEMDAWHTTTCTLYVRWTGPRSFEIGPRLETIPAARVTPAWRGELVAEGSRTIVTGAVRLPRFTEVVLGGWAIALVAWAAWLFPRVASGAENVLWLGAWGALALATLGATAVAWRTGLAALEARRVDLQDVATAATLDDDW